MFLQKSSSLPFSCLQISLADEYEKYYLILYSLSRVFLPEVEWYLVSMEAIFSFAFYTFILVSNKANISFCTSAIFELGIKQLANPAIKTSQPFSLAPVVPRQQPIFPLSRASKQFTPTSVKNPNFASGMANKVFSVAMIKGANALIPTPPPITIPSQHEICRALS